MDELSITAVNPEAFVICDKSPKSPSLISVTQQILKVSRIFASLNLGFGFLNEFIKKSKPSIFFSSISSPALERPRNPVEQIRSPSFASDLFGKISLPSPMAKRSMLSFSEEEMFPPPMEQLYIERFSSIPL